MFSQEWDPNLEAPTRGFISDLEQELRRVFLPTAWRWLSGWRRRWQEVEAAAEASEKDSSFIDEVLHDKTLQQLDERREINEKLRELIVLREKSDLEIVRLSQMAQELECERRDSLEHLMGMFYDYSRKHSSARFRPLATALVNEKRRRQVAQQVANSLCPERSLESRAAKRVAEIIGLGRTHRLDNDRVAKWISDGVSIVAVSAEILDEFASGQTERPELRTEANKTDVYDHELAEVFRLSIADGIDRDQIAASIEKYWTPELTAAEFIAGVSGRRRLKTRVGKPSIIGEMFELFGEPDRAWAWKDEYEEWLASELQRIADTDNAQPEGNSVDEGTSQTTQQTDRSDGSRINVEAAFPDDLRAQFIGQIIVDHPGFTARQICDAADDRRRQRSAERRGLAPREEWIRAIGETRSERDWMRDDNLWAGVSGLHRVEEWVSALRKKLGVGKRRAS